MARSAASLATRAMSSGSLSLKEVLAKQVPIKIAEMKDLKAKYGDESCRPLCRVISTTG